MLDVGGDPADPAVAARQAALLAVDDLARTDLRGAVADDAASAVAKHPAVRDTLLAFQRRFPGDTGAVLDGRDIGTVVFPDAALKLFVTADPAARARRRWEEVGRSVPLAEIEADMRLRDTRDRTRGTAPLLQADDAILIDTTALDADAALSCALELADGLRVRGG